MVAMDGASPCFTDCMSSTIFWMRLTSDSTWAAASAVSLADRPRIANMTLARRVGLPS